MVIRSVLQAIYVPEVLHSRASLAEQACLRRSVACCVLRYFAVNRALKHEDIRELREYLPVTCPPSTGRLAQRLPNLLGGLTQTLALLVEGGCAVTCRPCGRARAVAFVPSRRASQLLGQAMIFRLSLQP